MTVEAERSKRRKICDVLIFFADLLSVGNIQNWAETVRSQRYGAKKAPFSETALCKYFGLKQKQIVVGKAIICHEQHIQAISKVWD